MSGAALLVTAVTTAAEIILLWLAMAAWNPDPPRTAVGGLGFALGFLVVLTVMNVVPAYAGYWIDHP